MASESDPSNHPFDDLGDKGLLTEVDRNLLLGEKEYDDPQQRRGQRLRMRKRIRGGLKDFWFLVHCLPQEDRRQLVVELGEEMVSGNSLREPEARALVDVIAFVYALSDDLDLSFEDLVYHGLGQAREQLAPSPFALSEFSVSIETQSGIDVKEAIATIEEGRALTNFEYFELRRFLIEDAEVFLEATDHIELPEIDELDADDYLGLGESLVYFARVGTESAEEVEPNREVLHPRVERELLP